MVAPAHDLVALVAFNNHGFYVTWVGYILKLVFLSDTGSGVLLITAGVGRVRVYQTRVMQDSGSHHFERERDRMKEQLKLEIRDLGQSMMDCLK